MYTVHKPIFDLYTENDLLKNQNQFDQNDFIKMLPVLQTIYYQVTPNMQDNLHSAKHLYALLTWFYLKWILTHVYSDIWNVNISSLSSHALNQHIGYL